MEFKLNSQRDLNNLCIEIISKYPRFRVFFLEGDLGSGKTTFSNAFIKALGSIEDAQSPTFILHREYKLEENLRVNHIDLYRIDEMNELAELRLEKLRTSSDYVLIEWADKFEKILVDIFNMSNILRINFELGATPEERSIVIEEVQNVDTSN